MFRRLLLAGAGAAALTSLAPSLALAQAAPPSEALPPVVIEDEARAEQTYRFGDPIDSGTSTFSTEAVETRSPGSGDVNQLLKALPGAHFGLGEGLATRQNIQDLRPSEVSISGARINENIFLLDGVDASSRVEFGNTNAANYTELAGPSPQAFWVDSNLVGSLTVRDSNISAEYGRFTGGVVEILTRDPARAFGGQVYYNATNTDLTSFKITPATLDALGGATAPDQPEFDKKRYGVSLDLPVNDRLRLLAVYSRSEATVTYYRGVNYGSAAYGQQSVSENFMLKGALDLSDSLLLTAQLTYTPYESEGSSATAINNIVTSNGGGWTGRASLSGERGEATWKLDATFSRAESGRDGNPVQYNVSRTGTGVDWCINGSSCTNGFIGPLEQRESGYGLRGVWSQPLLSGEFRGGFDIQHVEAFKKRPFTTNAFLGTDISGATACANPNEGPSCVAGIYALRQRMEYRAFESSADLNTFALWGEQIFDVAGFTVRAGLRAEHDSFLGNTDLSPRLSATRTLPWGLTATVGANRYYNRSFLGYALREGMPGNYTYTRTPVVAGGVRTWTDNWVLTTHSAGTQYRNAELDTPYADELTVALTGDLLGGRFRIRAVGREGQDEFARSASTRVTYNTETGLTSTYTEYRVTNDGESSYRGLYLEWERNFGRHTVSLSTAFSETKTSNIDYWVEDDEEQFLGDMVYYNGAIRQKLAVLAENQREDYAAPLIVNGDWSSVWWDRRIKTTLNARFRDGFKQIGDSGANISVGGVSYDVYEAIEYDPSVDFNLNVSAEVVRSRHGTLTLDARIDNLLDTIPYRERVSTSEPYELGRSIWVGAKYRF